MEVLYLTTGTVDLAAQHLVRTDGSVTDLTLQDCALLGYLGARPHEDVRREELLTQVMGYASSVVSRAADDAIKRLRAKVERLPARPYHLVGVRRVGYRFVPLEPASGLGLLRLGDLIVDLERLEIRRGDAVRSLSAIDGRLLEVLAQHEGRPVHPEALLRKVWGIYDRRRRRLVDRAVYRLRQKIEEDPKHPRVLRTIRRRGLVLESVHVAPRPVLRPGRSAVPRTELVGRDRLVRRTIRLLEPAGARVVLAGPGGIGKSALARHVATSREGASVAVDLHGVRAESALARRLARALGVDSTDTDRICASASMQPGLLLVFDNADTAAHLVEPWLGRLADTRVLLTLRAPPGGWSHHNLVLGPLKPADGALLAGLRLQSSGVSVSDGDLERLSERLEGIPLAIELAVARLPELGLEALLAALSRPLEVLKGGPQGRHASLQAAIEVSTHQLTADARHLLMVLAGLPPEGTLDALRAVAARTRPALDFEPAQAMLMDHALVRVDAAGRTRLGWAVADVIQGWPHADTVRTSARDALLAWFAALWVPTVPHRVPQPGDVVALRANLDGALEAVEWGLRTGQTIPAAQIAIWAAFVLLHSGRASHAEALLRRVGMGDAVPEPLKVDLRFVGVEVFAHTLDVRTTRRWLAALAEVAPAGSVASARVIAGRYVLSTRAKDTDRAALEAELDAAIEAGSGLARARLLRTRGWYRARSGEPARARAQLEEALVLNRAGGADWDSIILYRYLAMLHEYSGDLDAAEAMLSARWELLAPVVQKEADGEGLVVLARIRMRMGRLTESIDLMQTQLLQARVQGHRGNITHQLGALANTLATAGRLEEALDAYQEALRNAVALGSRELVGSLNCNIAEVRSWMGQTEAAVAAFARAREIFGQTGQRFYGGSNDMMEARALWHSGEPDRARERLAGALEVLEQWGKPQGLAEALLLQAEMLAEHDPAQALAVADRGLGLARSGGDAASLIIALAARGGVASVLGDSELAWDLHSEAEDLLARYGMGERTGAARAIQRLNDRLHADL